jgi:hypothetical protein
MRLSWRDEQIQCQPTSLDLDDIYVGVYLGVYQFLGKLWHLLSHSARGAPRPSSYPRPLLVTVSIQSVTFN